MRMPFGKHKGVLIEDVPTAYLSWMLRSCDLERWLAAAVNDELASRRQERSARNEEPDGGYLVPAEFAEVLRRCHREMALRYHPDRGGSHEQMIVVNACFERLQNLLAQSAA